MAHAPIPTVERAQARERFIVTCGFAKTGLTARELRRTLHCMKVTAAVTREDAWYVARCLEVEVASQGETADEALDNLKEALELYFEDVESPEVLDPPIISTIELSA